MAVRLSHTDARGRVRMVDVGSKPETVREAVASSAIRMSASTLHAIVGTRASAGGPAGGSAGRPGPLATAKGDVLATARLAAIAALKRTSEWIPLCHPVRLVGSAVDIAVDHRLPGLRVRVTARAFDRTGVEMEAMVGASAAALTVYDMVKGVERGVEIVAVRLEEKRGGRTGEWRRPPEEGAARKIGRAAADEEEGVRGRAVTPGARGKAARASQTRRATSK